MPESASCRDRGYPSSAAPSRQCEPKGGGAESATLFDSHEAVKDSRDAFIASHSCTVMGVQRLDTVQHRSMDSNALQHLPEHSTRNRIKRLMSLHQRLHKMSCKKVPRAVVAVKEANEPYLHVFIPW